MQHVPCIIDRAEARIAQMCDAAPDAAQTVAAKIRTAAAMWRNRRGAQMKNGTTISTNKQNATENFLNHSACWSAHQPIAVGSGWDQ